MDEKQGARTCVCTLNSHFPPRYSLQEDPGAVTLPGFSSRASWHHGYRVALREGQPPGKGLVVLGGLETKGREEKETGPRAVEIK